MKLPNVKQLGFFDPVIGLTLLAIFGITGAAVNAAHSEELQQMTANTETETTVVQESLQYE